MSSSEIVRQKKRGRPRIGQLPVVGFRMDPVVQEEIDQWRTVEPDKPSRSRAIRHLIAFGLAGCHFVLLVLRKTGLPSPASNAAAPCHHGGHVRRVTAKLKNPFKIWTYCLGCNTRFCRYRCYTHLRCREAAPDYPSRSEAIRCLLMGALYEAQKERKRQAAKKN